MPWILFLSLYLIYDFSFPGLQLTIQYILPVIVGVVASGFNYDTAKLHWLYKRFFILSAAVGTYFAIGYIFMHGMTPFAAQTPMLLSAMAAITIGIFYITKKIRFAVLYGALFLMPFIDVTRMGLLVFLIILIFHFANKNIISKITFGVIGLGLLLIVFNSKGFQEKTFYGGKGDFSELSVNYYEPGSAMNTSGRSNFLDYYESGLKAAPLLGNGPRADMYVLKGIWGGKGISEAHNDYISVRYNYGYIGLGIMLYGFLATFFALAIKFANSKNSYKTLLLSSTMILTVTFLVYMYSDNILKSTVFFTDFYFALIGMSYAKIDD
jgi:hypothetical protein